MIGAVLPDNVAWAEAFDDPSDAWLFPEEEAFVAQAVCKRRREFATGRHCARSALATLGLAPQPILRGALGAPRWPAAVVGSITHCTSYRAAAVALAAEVASIGIDAEPHDSLDADILSVVARPAELEHLASLSREKPTVHWGRVLFCAKEAVYKAWYPLVHRWLGFEDAEVTLDANRGTFVARILVPDLTIAGHRIDAFFGRWHVTDTLVFAAVTLQRRTPPTAADERLGDYPADAL